MKAKILLAATSLVALLLQPLSASAVPENTWDEPTPSFGVNLVETFFNTGEGDSRLFVTTPFKNSSMPNEIKCETWGTKYPCNGSIPPNVNLLVGKCDGAELNCVESLSVTKKDEPFAEAKFLRQVVGPGFSAVPKLGLQAGKTMSLWSAGTKHTEDQDTYAVYMQLAMGYDQIARKVVPVGVSVLVLPYVEQDGDYEPATSKSEKLSGGRIALSTYGGRAECAWTEVGKCGRTVDFADDTQVELKVRLSKEISGWFKGRLVDPTLSVKSHNTKANLVTVKASPALVSTFKFATPVATAGKTLKKFFAEDLKSDPNRDDFKFNTRVDYSYGGESLEAFRSAADDTATGRSTVWSFGTSFTDMGHPCLKSNSKLLGIATTNSMVYTGGTPTYKNGYLSYSVAGMHYEPDGTTPVLGTYDLVMRSDTARCLYSWGKAPLSATVSVVNDKGTKTTATSVVSETKDGWLKMAAYNFTFSKKTIKVKITKKK
jgi:hypothetical protein